MNGERVDTSALSSRERRFLLGFLLSGNASASYLAIVTQVGSQAEHARQAASRMLARVKRRINWTRLLERLDIGALNLVRQLEAELTSMRIPEGDGAAALLSDLLSRRAAELTGPGTLAGQADDSADVCKKAEG